MIGAVAACSVCCWLWREGIAIAAVRETVRFGVDVGLVLLVCSIPVAAAVVLAVIYHRYGLVPFLSLVCLIGLCMTPVAPAVQEARAIARRMPCRNGMVDGRTLAAANSWDPTSGLAFRWWQRASCLDRLIQRGQDNWVPDE